MLEGVREWIHASTERDPHDPCPECGGRREEAYVRDPDTQGHFRGVEALVCEDCGHAERLAR